jgi:CRISPR-associated protein Cas5t
MPIVVVEAVAPVASWRPAEALTYHRTLPLPPYTTQVGMLAAALGLPLEAGYRFVAEHALQLGVGGWHGGHARDLWKHQKLSGEGHVSDILLRELWTDARLALVIEAPNTETAERVADAYRRPAYPLTAGTSDALMHAVTARVEEIGPQPTIHLIHTLVYGEISLDYKPYFELKDIPLTHTVRAPTVEHLPTGFTFDEEGQRQLGGRALVTFVADAIELQPNVPPVVGYRVVPQTQPMRSEYERWKKGELEWTIPVHRYDLTPAQEDHSSTPLLPSAPTRKLGRKSSRTEGT